MKKLLNTLYVTSENSYLALDGENIVVFEEKMGPKVKFLTHKQKWDDCLCIIWKELFLSGIGEQVLHLWEHV